MPSASAPSASGSRHVQSPATPAYIPPYRSDCPYPIRPLIRPRASLHTPSYTPIRTHPFPPPNLTGVPYPSKRHSHLASPSERPTNAPYPSPLSFKTSSSRTDASSSLPLRILPIATPNTDPRALQSAASASTSYTYPRSLQSAASASTSHTYPRSLQSAASVSAFSASRAQNTRPFDHYATAIQPSPSRVHHDSRRTHVRHPSSRSRESSPVRIASSNPDPIYLVADSSHRLVTTTSQPHRDCGAPSSNPASERSEKRRKRTSDGHLRDEPGSSNASTRSISQSGTKRRKKSSAVEDWRMKQVFLSAQTPESSRTNTPSSNPAQERPTRADASTQTELATSTELATATEPAEVNEPTGCEQYFCFDSVAPSSSGPLSQNDAFVAPVASSSTDFLSALLASIPASDLAPPSFFLNAHEEINEQEDVFAPNRPSVGWFSMFTSRTPEPAGFTNDLQFSAPQDPIHHGLDLMNVQPADVITGATSAPPHMFTAAAEETSTAECTTAPPPLPTLAAETATAGLLTASPQIQQQPLPSDSAPPEQADPPPAANPPARKGGRKVKAASRDPPARKGGRKSKAASRGKSKSKPKPKPSSEPKPKPKSWPSEASRKPSDRLAAAALRKTLQSMETERIANASDPETGRAEDKDQDQDQDASREHAKSPRARHPVAEEEEEFWVEIPTLPACRKAAFARADLNVGVGVRDAKRSTSLSVPGRSVLRQNGRKTSRRSSKTPKRARGSGARAEVSVSTAQPEPRAVSDEEDDLPLVPIARGGRASGGGGRGRGRGRGGRASAREEEVEPRSVADEDDELPVPSTRGVRASGGGGRERGGARGGRAGAREEASVGTVQPEPRAVSDEEDDLRLVPSTRGGRASGGGGPKRGGARGRRAGTHEQASDCTSEFEPRSTTEDDDLPLVPGTRRGRASGGGGRGRARGGRGGGQARGRERGGRGRGSGTGTRKGKGKGRDRGGGDMDGGSGSPVVSAATTTITTRVPDWLATQQAIDVPAPTSASGPGMDFVSHHGSSSSSTQVSPDTMYLYSDLGIMHSGPSSFLPSHFHPDGPALPPPPVATLNSRPQPSSSLGQTQGARPASSTLESASLSKETGSAVAMERSAPRKRPIAIACDSCNKKHRRCDDIDPSHPVACTNCFTNGYECNYSKAAKSFAEELPA